MTPDVPPRENPAVMVGVEYSPAPPAARRPASGAFGVALVTLMWRAKWLLLAAALAGGVLGAATGIGVKDKIAARMVLQSAGRQSAAGAASAISQITSLVGLGGSREDREFSQFKAMMRSVALAERLQQKYGLMQVIFAATWDEQRKRWIEPTTLRHRLGAKLRQLRGLPRWTEPSIYDLAEQIEKQVEIDPVKYSSFIYEVTYRSDNAEFAVKFLDMLHKESEAALREEQRQRALEQVRYLRGRIETTPIVEYRLSLVQLMSDQDKTLMLLDSNLPFAVNVIDPPHIVRIDPPKPGLRAAIGGGIGLAAGALLVLIYAALRLLVRRRKPPKLVPVSAA